jgi:hypothetical protein
VSTTLPGMPLAASDIFVCKIDEGRPTMRAAPEPPPAPPKLVWLVLALCKHCNPRTGRYCTAHDVRRRR